MTAHAFIDESQRGHSYLVCVVLVDPGDLPGVRGELRAMPMPGQRRLHFVNESPRRRRQLLAAMSKLPVRARVYISTNKEPIARRQALAAILSDSRAAGIERIIIERREPGQDARERRQIAGAIRAGDAPGALSYQHLSGYEEPLLLGSRRRSMVIRSPARLALPSEQDPRTRPRRRPIVTPKRARVRPLTVR